MGVRTDFPRAVRRIDHTWIPLADGTRLAARIWLPEDAERDPVPAHPRVPALPQGRRLRRARLLPPPLLRRPRLRGRAGRPARHRRLRRDHRGRVPAPGAGGRARGASRGWREQPWCSGAVGHARHLLGRLQRPAGRRAPPAGAEGGHLDVRQRRPLRRRRALRRRLRARRRHAAVGGDDAHAATRCRPTRPSSATAGATRGCERIDTRRPSSSAWLTPPAPRRLLAAGLGVRGLRGDRRAPCTRSAAGPTATATRPAADRGPARPAQGADRPVVARLPAGRRARPGDRLPAGVPALVRPAAQGHRHRDHGRAEAARVDAGPRRAGRPPRRAPRALGRRAGVAAAAGAGVDAGTFSRARSRSRTAASSPTGLDAGAWCADGGEGDWPRRPARRGRALAELHLGAAGGADRDPRLPRGRARARGRPPGRAARRAPVRRRARRRIAARHARRAQPHPPRRPRATRSRSSPGSRYEVALPLDAHRPARSRPGHRLRVARLDRRTGRGCGPSPEPVTLALHAGRLRAARARTARRGSWPNSSRPRGGAARGGDDRARPDEPHARRTTWPPARTSCASSGTSAATAAWSTARTRDGRHERHDLPHRRRRSALGRACAAVRLGARPRRLAHARPRPTRR